MLRMISNNTSDYVATDLIQNLWCLHHEKYGHLFPNEPHHCKEPCKFDHQNPPIQFGRRDHIYTQPRENQNVKLMLNSYVNLELLNEHSQVVQRRNSLGASNRGRPLLNNSSHEYSTMQRTEIS